MTPTKVRDLAGYAVAAGLLSWLVVRQWYGDLPRLSWFVPLSPALLALAEAIAGGRLRAGIRRRPGARPVRPLVAARSVALAKASSLVGALMLGLWGGLVAYALGQLTYLAAAPADARTAGVGIVAALCLVGAALWLEWCCRTPRTPDNQDRIGPNGSALP